MELDELRIRPSGDRPSGNSPFIAVFDHFSFPPFFFLLDQQFHAPRPKRQKTPESGSKDTKDKVRRNYLFIYLFPFYLTRVALSVSSTVLPRGPVSTIPLTH